MNKRIPVFALVALLILGIRLWPAPAVSAADFPSGMRAATFSMW